MRNNLSKWIFLHHMNANVIHLKLILPRFCDPNMAAQIPFMWVCMPTILSKPVLRMLFWTRVLFRWDLKLPYCIRLSCPYHAYFLLCRPTLPSLLHFSCFFYFISLGQLQLNKLRQRENDCKIMATESWNPIWNLYTEIWFRDERNLNVCVLWRVTRIGYAWVPWTQAEKHTTKKFCLWLPILKSVLILCHMFATSWQEKKRFTWPKFQQLSIPTKQSPKALRFANEVDCILWKVWSIIAWRVFGHAIILLSFVQLFSSPCFLFPMRWFHGRENIQGILFRRVTRLRERHVLWAAGRQTCLPVVQNRCVSTAALHFSVWVNWAILTGRSDRRAAG